MARKKIAVKKKVARKKASGGASPAGAAAPASAGATKYKAPKEPKLPGEGFGIGPIIMLLVSLALMSFVVFVFLPRDLSAVDGYPFDPSSAPNPPRNLLREASEGLIEGDGSVTFSEKDVNNYINQRLNGTQRGGFAAIAKMNGIYMDLKEREATIYIERKIFGLPFTIDSTWEYYLSSGEYVRGCTGCSVGRFKFEGKMFQPIMKPFMRFFSACEPENKVLTDKELKSVKLQDGKMVLEF